MWEISGNSVFVIPANTLLIAAGLRALFCKMQLDLMKTLLFTFLGILYLTSAIGLALYSTAADLELLKLSFFLQYIILTISIVLGLVAELIAFVMMAFYFMKLLQAHIRKMARLHF